MPLRQGKQAGPAVNELQVEVKHAEVEQACMLLASLLRPLGYSLQATMLLISRGGPPAARSGWHFWFDRLSS